MDEVQSWSIAKKLYRGKERMRERHRLRYEVNLRWVQRIRPSVGKGVDGEGEILWGRMRRVLGCNERWVSFLFLFTNLI